MGIYDRDYGRDGFDSGGGYGSQIRFAFPTITPMVKKLLIINIAVFLPCILVPRLGDFLFEWFSVYPSSIWRCLQIWRPITYQFLHDTNSFWHICGNMFILFFCGRILEGYLGSKKFIIFYLISGSLGGIFYTFLVIVNVLQPNSLIGASGAIFGVMAAGALLFPRIQFYFFGVFPIPYFVLAVIYTVGSLFFILKGSNVGGEATHLVGVAAGVVYVMYKPWIQRSKIKIGQGNWERKVKRERDFQADVDRILEKVHNSGMASLTRKEKRILKEATKREQEEGRL
jgi:membrane associated rhomboid family serine protease